jgi:CheY-like chemotaxis protein
MLQFTQQYLSGIFGEEELAMKDSKLLVIGTPVISKAIIKVLSMLPSFQSEYIEVSDFRKLDELYDRTDIRGIILTPPDEVELAKHIRLTETTGRISILPIIILSQYPLEQHLRDKNDNIFLLSPGIEMIQLSSFITVIMGAFDKVKPLKSMEDMRKDLKPFIVWSTEDDVASRHDNLNRYGPFKLMKEHFEVLPSHLSREYETFISRLWFKKYCFLESESIRSQDSSVEEDLFRKTIANKHILYVDDEHRLGWSFALYSIFMEDSEAMNYQLFQDNAHFIITPNNRFACIDRFEDASIAVDSYKRNLSIALSEYSETEISRSRFTGQLYDIRKTVKELESKNKISEDNFSRSKINMTEAEAKVKVLQQQLKVSMDAFADEYLRGTSDVDIPDILPQVSKMADIHEQYIRIVNDLVKVRDEYNRSQLVFEKNKSELEKQRPLLEEAETKNTAVLKRYDEVLKELSPGRLFPYDLIILDLRLEREKDKDRLPHEISGVKILRQIKEADPSIPVLVFTASEKAMNYREAVEFGASGYWIKAINSLSSLKSEVIKALARAKDMRDLWLGIRKVEAKKQLSCLRENSSTRNLEKGIMNESKKSDIVMLLKESFLLLVMTPTPYEKSVCDFTNYGKIALNMGMIHEERTGRIRDDRWDYHVRQRAREIDQVEISIRQTRNTAAHQRGSTISYEDALGVFQKSLEKCLNF